MPSAQNFAIARWSKPVRILTVSITVAITVQAIIMLALAIFSHGELVPRIVFACAGLVSVMVLSMMYAFAPLSYRINGDYVTVVRWGPNYRVPLSEIESACQADGSILHGSIRVLGCGGVCGYYGRYASPSLGPVRMYITRKEGIVVMRLKGGGRTLVVSPMDPAAFISAIDEAISSQAQ